MFGQLCEGVDYLHRLNIVHRDLKLENVLLDSQQNIRIIDFGLAVSIRSHQQILTSYCGTPEYQAPEIHKKQPYKGPPTDIWSLGVMLHALVMGELPFTGINRQHVARRASRGLIEMPGVSKLCQATAKAMIQLEPERRVTAQELLESSWTAHHRMEASLTAKYSEYQQSTHAFEQVHNEMQSIEQGLGEMDLRELEAPIVSEKPEEPADPTMAVVNCCLADLYGDRL